jgi:hypothetical protein
MLSLIVGSSGCAQMLVHSLRLPAPRRNAFLLRPGSLRRPPIDKLDRHVELRPARKIEI